MKKYHIITHGCQMNEHDSERIAGILESLGYLESDNLEEADLVLFNTCLIRENAELKVYGQIGALKKWKQENPDKILAVSGCMMQTGPAKKVLKESFPQVNLVFGTQNIDKLPILLDRLNVEKRVFDTGIYDEDKLLEKEFNRQNGYSAYVNIMTGCNNFCTYCIVPYARGREGSRPAEDIFREVQKLGAEGYKEIMLLGQNVNSYGNDNGSDMDFPSLLKRLCLIDGIERIRFMSSHPKDLSDKLIEVIAEEEKIERHFHLPLQSGSDKVLKEMNRNYDTSRFRELADKLRKNVPGISITTDIIVGFPGETEKEHKETLDFCKELEFDNAFTFIYSPRPGTRAARRADQVDKEVQSRRYSELTETLYPIFNKKNKEMLGKTLEVLFESPSKNDPNRISGRDSTNRLIHVKGDTDLIGQIKKVKITGSNSFALMGKLV